MSFNDLLFMIKKYFSREERLKRAENSLRKLEDDEVYYDKMVAMRKRMREIQEKKFESKFGGLK